MKSRSLIWILIILLSGCGFKLRGSMDMPTWFNHLAIINQGAHRDVQLLLKDQFQAYGITVLTEPRGSSYQLILEKDVLQEQITSVSASTTPRQYQLIYTVYYSLIKTGGAPIISSNQIIVSRQFTVNNDRILGSNAEESTIANEMRRDAAMQIMNRINHKLH